MQIGDVQEIANELFDGDAARFNELVSGVNEKFTRLDLLEKLLQEMVNNPPGKTYFVPWSEKLKKLGIQAKINRGK